MPDKINCKRQTRRQFVTTLVTVTCCGGLGSAVTAARSSDQRVDQITDPTTTAAKDMFRFEPDLAFVEPGDTVTFLNSRGEHTVHSIKGMWPSQVETVSIAANPEVPVLFPQEGFYPFRCQRHGQYGMVMLVVAGKPSNWSDMVTRIDGLPYRRREKAALRNLFGRVRRV